MKNNEKLKLSKFILLAILIGANLTASKSAYAGDGIIYVDASVPDDIVARNGEKKVIAKEILILTA